MSNRGPKLPRSKPRPDKPSKILAGSSLLKRMAGVGSAIVGLIGLAAALLAFLPRVTAVVSDPPDENNPFSSSVTVTNTGSIHLNSVRVEIAWKKVQYMRTDGPFTILGNKAGGSILIMEKWPPRDLGLDDRFTESLNDITMISRESLISAEIDLIVEYHIPFLGLRREKRFPIFTKRASNGNFRWYSDIATKNPN